MTAIYHSAIYVSIGYCHSVSIRGYPVEMQWHYEACVEERL